MQFPYPSTISPGDAWGSPINRVHLVQALARKHIVILVSAASRGHLHISLILHESIRATEGDAVKDGTVTARRRLTLIGR